MTDHALKSESNLSVQPIDEIPEEARLWRAVVGQAVRDIYCGEKSARREVALWIKSRDFDTCCDLAFLPAKDIKAQIVSLLNMPQSLANKYGRALREVIVSDIYV